MKTFIEKIDQMASSRTVWTLIFLLIINVIPEVKDLFSEGQQVYLNVLLTVAATYFKVFPSQQYK